MVAKVISGKDVKGALNYNEQKVLTGDANCINAHLFAKEPSKLTFQDKLNRFTNLNERNTRTRTNTLHISLNFDPSEKIAVDQLNSIADSYMSKIGFGNQPYLVYEHTDAAHQHVHVVTTLIQESGKRIPIHYLGKNESEKARKEIEREFGLIQAQGRKVEIREVSKQLAPQKVIYGKSVTTASVKAVVRAVVSTYRYTSLAELNAVLRRYNVTADRGSEKSQMFTRKGLLYCIIDRHGNRVGVPVKASAIPGKPTLPFLEKQFALNRALRTGGREVLKATIDQVLESGSSRDKESFRQQLEKRGIDVVFRINPAGRLYGMTFIDERSKVVFNGSDLGKPYSGNAILDRLSVNGRGTPPAAPKVTVVKDHSTIEADLNTITEASLLKDLVSPESQYNHPSSGVDRRRRKRRRLRW